MTGARKAHAHNGLPLFERPIVAACLPDIGTGRCEESRPKFLLNEAWRFWRGSPDHPVAALLFRSLPLTL